MAQANAFQLTKGINEITVTQTDGAVILPEGIEGMSIKIKNNSTADVRVFPTSLGVINDLGADGFYILPFDNSEVFNCFKPNNWYSQGSGIWYVAKQIETAEVLTLNSSPVELIAAPGAGKVILIIGHPTVELIFNTTAYASFPAVELLTDTASQVLYQLPNFLNQAASRHRLMNFQISSSSTTHLVENKSVVIQVNGGDPTLGDSPIVVRANYQIKNSGIL